MRLKVLKAFIIRDLKILFSDKAAIFWIIAWPLIWIFMVAYVFVPPGSDRPVQLDVGVLNNDNSTTPFNGSLLIKIMNETKYNGYNIFKVKLYRNETKLRNDLKKGLLDVGIIIPEKFGLNVTYSTGKLKVLVGARDPTSGSISESIIEMFVGRVNTLTGLYKVNITLYYIKLGFSNSSYSYVNYTRMNSTGQWYSFYGNKSFIEFLEEYMRGMVVSINASYEDVKPEAFMDRPSILGWYVVGAIGMMFLYSGFTLGATMIVDEKELGTLKRLLATPIKESEFIIAKVLSGITTLVLSALIAILVGVFLVRAKIVFNPLNPIHWLVPLLLFLGAFMTIGLGAMLSLIARSSSGATSLGTALGLFLSFTAGIWLPSYMMPQIFKLLAMYFPVAWIIDTIRCILIFGRYSEALAMMPKIIVSTIIILVIDWFIYKVNLRKYAEE